MKPETDERPRAVRWRSAWWLLIFLTALGPRSGRAEGPSSTGRPQQAASDEPPPLGYLADGSTTQARIAEAYRLFSGGRFVDAAELLQQVIAVEPKPIHIFNLGQSQRRAGRIDEAIASYRRFVTEAPSHPSLSEAKSYLRELETVAAERQRAEQYNQQLAQTRGELLTERTEADRLRRQRPVYKKAWFWVVIGGVVSGAVVAGAVGGILATRQPTPPPTDTGYVGFSF